MAHPQISVIIPVYNTSGYLVQCLDTLVNQTFADTEIICVNDGSTDNSLEILKAFSEKDSRIIIISREKASGSAALPRNIGLENAKGKYVMFLDSDDYFDLSMLEKLYAHAEQTDADLVMCDNYTVSFSTGEINAKHTELHHKYLPEQRVFSYKDIPDTIFQISNAAVWHKLILRETLNRHNLKFQLNTPILDDIYFVNVLLVLCERISIIPDRLVYYRAYRYGGQTTKMEKHKDSIYLSFKALNEFLIEHSLYEPIKFSLQNWTLATMAWWLHSIGNYKVFCELFNLYKNEYFEKLGLTDIDPKLLYDGLARFYNSIYGRELEPSLKVVLESILKPNSSVAIYGAGLVGHNIYEVVNTHGVHKIKLWCDKNAANLGNPLVSSPKELLNCDCDAIFIAIADYDIVNEVKAYLTAMGIDARKIYTV